MIGSRLGRFVLLSLLAGTGAFAQIGTPSPSPTAGRQVYVFRFAPELSRLFVEGATFQDEAADRTEDGCELVVAENGPLVCIKKDSCTNDRPACGVIFEGPAGLALPQVAELEPLSPGTARLGLRAAEALHSR
ncbi:MAG: hypothetical protein NDJ89_05800 [Oligoflexia bacterium]|nr:hypothetical protein [Oligoflexia bacterium]